jgi:hypothetical protein
MAYAQSTVATRDLVSEKSERARSSLFHRLVEAISQSRQRRAEREIARYLKNTKFTDEAEREIERQFFRTPSRW